MSLEMARHRSKSSDESTSKSYRNPNLLSYYHDCASRVFYNGGRANEYLHNLFLKAAKNGEIERIRNFLKRSSKSNNVNVDYRDKTTGNTAIFLAALGNHVEVVQLLLNYGADITLHNEQGQSVIELAPESIRHILLASVERQGVSHRHLLQAAWQGNVEVLKRLLSSHADLNVNCKNADGMTPLLLVTRDVNLFERIEKAVTERGYHPLEVVQELLHHNADPSAVGTDGKSALHYIASNKGQTAEEMTIMILEGQDASLEIPDKMNCFPIHIASKEDNVPILLALINSGADVNTQGYKGQTALHMSAAQGHERCSSVLIDNGADVTVVDDHGCSPVDVTTSKRIHRVLREAWAQQTNGNIVKARRSFSAPNQNKRTTIKEPQKAQTASPDKRNNLSPQRRCKPAPKRSPNITTNDNGQSSFSPSKTKKGVARSKSLTVKPSPPCMDKNNKVSISRTSRVESKQLTRQLSIRSHEAAIFTQEGLQLPKLSIKNIELQHTSNADFTSLASIQQVRFLTTGHSRSLPGTPSTLGSYGCGASPARRPFDFTQIAKRSKIPTRIAPLPGQKPRTPDLTLSPDTLRSGSSFGNVGQIVDLDFLQSSSIYLNSLVNQSGSADSWSLSQPPSSPCDMTETMIESGKNGNEHEMQNEYKEKQVLHLASFDEADVSGDNEGENKIEMKESEKENEKEKENTDNIDESNVYPTQTLNTEEISSFWIPNDCLYNEKAQNTQLRQDAQKDVSEQKRFEKQQMKDANRKSLNKSDKQEKAHNGQMVKCTSSVSFYVNLNDITEYVKCASCNKQLDPIFGNSKHICETCKITNHPKQEVFWFTLDGKTTQEDENIENDKLKLLSSTNESNIVRQQPICETSEINELKVPSEGTFIKKSDTKISNEHNVQAGGMNDDINPAFSSGGTFVIDANKDNGSVEGETGLPEKDKDARANSDVGKEHLYDGGQPTLVSEETFVIDENKDTKLVGGENILCLQTQGKPESNLDTRPKDLVDNKNIDDNGQIVLHSITRDNETKIDTTEDPCAKVNSNETHSGKEGRTTNRGSNANMNETSSHEVDHASWQNFDGLQTVEGHTSTWSHHDGVKICNAFPSPVPPPNTKPEIQPPIGEKQTIKRKMSGKKGRKQSPAKRKNTQCRTGSGKEQTKIGKKKIKKKNQSFKEITVNQSSADVAYIAGGCELGDVSLGVPSPDVDNAPTLSIDPKTFSCKIMKKTFPVLSPIPESPYSNTATPRSLEVRSCLACNELNSSSGDIITCDTQIQGCVLQQTKEYDNNQYGSFALRYRSSGERATNIVHNVLTKKVNDDTKQDVYDEVDGVLISRMLAMCIPRLNIISDNSDKEELLHNDDVFEDDNDDDDDGNGDDNEHDSIIHQNTPQNILQKDEADDDMENMLQEIKQNTNDILITPLTEQRTDNQHIDNSDENDLVGGQDETIKISGEPVVSLSDSDKLHKQNKVVNKHERTMTYINQIAHMSQSSVSDDVFQEQEPHKSQPLRDEVIVDDVLSDNDSSYISCDSTPRCVSDCSTFESSDSVLSPQNSRVITRNEYTSHASVDITVHEQAFKTQNSSSSDSRSTISNNSVVSTQSFFAATSRPFVRSQVSIGSISSIKSCGEEIQWQKGSILGKGGFGTVWLGLVNTGEMIAVKQVELNNNDDSEAEKQYAKLQEEVSLLKSLQHENIVRYIGTCLDENFVVNIFMEYVPGGSIAQALKRFGAFVEPVFRRYTKQILCGVKYLHDKDVMHRDIKGGNIMLMPNGVIKLIDFGCAKRLCMNLSLSRSSILHSIKGTPYWMAPEVIRETGAGTKSDIWSIGCTVFEMATGSPPWSEMQPMAAIFSIGNGSTVPQLSESFSQLARDFTSACMTREPDARPSATELLQHKFLT